MRADQFLYVFYVLQYVNGHAETHHKSERDRIIESMLDSLAFNVTIPFNDKNGEV